ncbi:MAG TPA: DNA-formamidopyrimidine glycosylase family protein [Methanomassiliicoccales archaeon]|nr:DNA-formamidopyrimidine glycosylase family protein [Methanomassiliicoccales archaeon]
MPELPEVEMVCRRIAINGVGRTILRAEVRDERALDGITAAQLRSGLIGRQVTEARRHGKRLFLILDDGNTLTMHLGMTGDVLFSDGPVKSGGHDRVVVRFSSGGMVFRDQRLFGAIGLCGDVQENIACKGLGPDALVITSKEFSERIGGRNRPIKTVLLDQSITAGVGNLYADEMLFQCKVHPMTSARELGPRHLLCLHRAMREILNLSIELGSDFERLPGRYLLRDRSIGAPCPRDGTGLRAERVNGRTAIFCPACQRRR